MQPENVFKFDTIEKYLAAVDTHVRFGNSGRWGKERYDFTHTKSFDEALTLARRGWTDGANKARKFQGSLSETISTQSAPKGTWRKTMTGGAIRVPAYIQGRPDCFLTYKQVRETKFITMVYTGGASGGIDAEVLVRKGTMVAAAIDLLEARNIRVKLVLGYNNNEVTELYVTLKEHSESLDLDRIAFFIAHPSALRRIRFAFYETIEDSFIRSAGNGNGRSYDPTFKGDVFIPRSFLTESQWSSVESTMEHIRQLLKVKGIEL
jgi:hypothetical protein